MTFAAEKLMTSMARHNTPSDSFIGRPGSHFSAGSVPSSGRVYIGTTTLSRYTAVSTADTISAPAPT